MQYIERVISRDILCHVINDDVNCIGKIVQTSYLFYIWTSYSIGKSLIKNGIIYEKHLIRFNWGLEVTIKERVYDLVILVHYKFSHQ